MKKVLIQLIGGQTLPNIFSMIAVVPDVVVNIYTKDTMSQHEAIVAWCEKNGKKFNLNPVFREYPPVSRDFLQLRIELQGILNNEAELIRNEEDALLILNMTGGTKPMSVTSTQLCSVLEHYKNIRIPVFYVDTQMRRFDFLTHEEMRDDVLAHAPFSRRLNVYQLAESGGNTFVMSSKKNWGIVYPAAYLLRECCDNLSQEDLTVDNVEEIIQLPMELLVKEGGREAVKVYVERALQNPDVVRGLESCGFAPRDGSFYFSQRLREKADQIIRLKNEQEGINRGKIKRLLSDIQSTYTFLTGGWWEVIVAHAYSFRNPGSEVLWSVRTPVGKGAPLETDIVATDGLSLTCISCKRGLHKQVNQELEQLCTRTEILGGAISKRIIAVYRDAMKMAPMAKALRMELWGWNGESVGKLEIEDKSTTN